MLYLNMDILYQLSHHVLLFLSSKVSEMNVHVLDFVNSVGQDKMAHNELPYQSPQYLPSRL